MVRTPCPSSPTRTAYASWYSISDEALARLPSLSFRRWISMPFGVPSGRQRGAKKQHGPSSVRATVKKPSLIGAEQNHLCPFSR
jgi:hypothetical protein